MAKKRRTPITPSVQAAVDYQSDRRCCVCQHHETQLHHINEDPGDNRFQNLALLCLRHHDEATRTGGLTRRLAPATVRRYREAWYEEVRKTRESRQAPPRQRRAIDPAQLRLAVVEGSAIHAIRGLGYELAVADWPSVEVLLDRLSAYGNTLVYGPAIGLDYLNAVDSVVGRARHETPEIVGNVAARVADAAARVLPIVSLVRRRRRRSRIAPVERVIFDMALHLGGTLAYDGAKYLRELRVVDSGCDVLWRVLRFAHLNGHQSLETAAIEEFDDVLDAAAHARGGEFVLAREWIDYRRRDALADPKGEPVVPPTAAWAALGHAQMAGLA